MGIQDHDGPCGVEIAVRLRDLRREIGILRRELLAAGQAPQAMWEESYRAATQIDLLVSRFLRLVHEAGRTGIG